MVRRHVQLTYTSSKLFHSRNQLFRNYDHVRQSLRLCSVLTKDKKTKSINYNLKTATIVPAMTCLFDGEKSLVTGAQEHLHSTNNKTAATTY